VAIIGIPKPVSTDASPRSSGEDGVGTGGAVSVMVAVAVAVLFVTDVAVSRTVPIFAALGDDV
jgi:hypothetical protein